MGIKVEPECFVCFKIFPDGGIPKCTGEKGEDGTQHDMCGECIRELAAKVVHEDQNNLRPDGIRCSVTGCNGTFTTDELEAFIDRDVYEVIRAYGQMTAFEEAWKHNLPVIQCKKCTFFSVFDDPPEVAPHFHCEQCKDDHCRQCGGSWDEDHKKINKCAELVRETRRLENKRKQDHIEAKKKELEEEKEKKRRRDEARQMTEEEERRKQNESKSSPKTNMNYAKAQYEDIVRGTEPPDTVAMQHKAPQSSTDASQNSSTTINAAQLKIVDDERLIKMEEKLRINSDLLDVLRRTSEQIDTNSKTQQKNHNDAIESVYATAIEAQTTAENERRQREALTELVHNLQAFAIRMTNQFEEQRERYEMDHGQLVLQLQTAQLQSKEKSAETEDLIIQVETLRDSQTTLVKRVADQQSIMMQQQKLLDDYSASYSAAQSKPIRPPPPQNRANIRASVSETDLSELQSTVQLEQKTKHTGDEFPSSHHQPSSIGPPLPPPPLPPPPASVYKLRTTPPFEALPPTPPTTSPVDGVEKIADRRSRMMEELQQMLRKS